MSEKIMAILYCPDAYESDGCFEDIKEMIEADSIEELIAEALRESVPGAASPHSLWVLDPALSERLVTAFNERREQDRLAAERQRIEFEEGRKRDAEIRRADKVTALRLLIEGLEDGTELAKAKAELEALEAPSLAPGGEA